ncbi:MAG: dimethylmenaquinone methyltransferase [Phycisphaerae bacterium]|nr:dimethylmenaquinone methyltransferase [Phycisphaerae bacterium]
MSDNKEQPSILELQARWNRIRVANLYDTLDPMGYPNQCIDLDIRPLFPNQHLAGMAITVRGTRDPRTREEMKADWEKAKAEGKTHGPMLHELMFPGCVIVVDGGGELYTGKFGEMTSWGLKQSGATGIVIDGFIRDKRGLEVIPDYTVCARGTSPIESAQRWSQVAVNVPIGMPGTLTSQVPVRPGDWIVGGMDGVIVVPKEIAMEVLVKAEEIEAREQGMRDDLATGMSFKDAFDKWGRA